MGAVSVDGRDGEFIQSTGEMFARFSAELLPQLDEWERRLLDDPASLEMIEHDVQQAFMRGAGLMVAGLVSVTMQTAEVLEAAEQTRQQFSQPLAPGRERRISVNLLGGVMMWVTSLYCQCRRGPDEDTDENGFGVYTELALFGFGKKVSPAVESKIARQAALCPSLALAHQELQRDGLTLDVKTVRRVARQCGDELLKLRTTQLQQWRAGTLPSTEELAAQRITVQIDGGRTKIRGELGEVTPKPVNLNEFGMDADDAPGRSKPRPARSYQADWREPKLLTIFIHDEQGRMQKKSQATIDGTFAGPDATAELVAMHLHRLGAAQAASITFVSDGAVWIWDRIESIVRHAGIPDTVTIHQVLDNCHAAHHVSLALATLGVEADVRMPLYRDMRTRLRNGQWRSVVAELQELADANPGNTQLPTEIAYLRRHGEAGRLAYPTFRGLGIPLGSGAIESSIRRVINLRLKGNGIFWKQESAESMLQLRALVTSNRWDTRMAEMRTHKRSIHRSDWQWIPQTMTIKSEDATTTLQTPA